MRLYYILVILLSLPAFTVSAQSEEWKLIHKGNRLFHDKQYNAAGKLFEKSLKINPNNARASYNLGNVRTAQNNPEEALKLYQAAAEHEKSPLVRSMAYHNRGYIHQRLAGASSSGEEKQNNLKAAIAEYKRALRENPALEASRYNLALCQKQLKENKDRQNRQQQQQQQQDKQQQQEKPDNQPLINYARQAEKRTRDKLNARPRQRALDKNW